MLKLSIFKISHDKPPWNIDIIQSIKSMARWIHSAARGGQSNRIVHDDALRAGNSMDDESPARPAWLPLAFISDLHPSAQIGHGEPPRS